MTKRKPETEIINYRIYLIRYKVLKAIDSALYAMLMVSCFLFIFILYLLSYPFKKLVCR